MKRTLALVLGLMLFGSALSACNTVQGVGRDIERAGESIQGAAKK